MHKWGRTDYANIWAKGLPQTMYKSVPGAQSATFISNLHCLLNKVHVCQDVRIIQSAQLLHVAERNFEIIPKLK